MKTITITKSDLDSNNKYKEGFIGTYTEYADVSVEIAENLGYVMFEKGIYVNGSIVAKAGSGIKAGWGIEAGSGIKAGSGIVSFYSWIRAKLAIDAKFTISAGIFSVNGAQDIEAQEINGNVIFGNKKLLPKKEESSLIGTLVEVKVGDKTYKATITE